MGIFEYFLHKPSTSSLADIFNVLLSMLSSFETGISALLWPLITMHALICMYSNDSYNALW